MNPCVVCHEIHQPGTTKAAAHAVLLRAADPDKLRALIEDLAKDVAADIADTITRSQRDVSDGAVRDGVNKVLGEIGTTVGIAFVKSVDAKIAETLAESDGKPQIQESVRRAPKRMLLTGEGMRIPNRNPIKDAWN